MTLSTVDQQRRPSSRVLGLPGRRRRRILVLRLQRGQPQGTRAERQPACGADVLLVPAGPPDPAPGDGGAGRRRAQRGRLPGPVASGPGRVAHRRSQTSWPARPRAEIALREARARIAATLTWLPKTGPSTPWPQTRSSSGRPTSSAGTPGCATSAPAGPGPASGSGHSRASTIRSIVSGSGQTTRGSPPGPWPPARSFEDECGSESLLTAPLSHSSPDGPSGDPRGPAALTRLALLLLRP